MGFKQFVALTIGLLHISLSSCQEFEVAEKQCVPYSSCSEISWLYQNGALQNEIDPNELTCGYENGNVHYFIYKFQTFNTRITMNMAIRSVGFSNGGSYKIRMVFA